MADKGRMELDGLSAFADNECAQALLDLAKSHSPPNGSLMRESSGTSAHYNNAAPDMKGKRSRDGKSGKNSILKHQLEHTEHQTMVSHMAEDYDPVLYTRTDCASKEEVRVELVKRIHLDHNYPCSGDFSWNKYVKSLAHIAEFPGKTSPKFAEGRFKQQGQSYAHGGPKGKRNSPENKHSSGKSPTRGLKSWKSKESPNNSLYGQLDLFDVKEESKMKQTPCTSLWQHRIPIPQMKTEKENISDSSISPSQDLYQPNDSKYKNFNLLLKCLTNEEGVTEKVCVERCDSTRSGSVNDGSDDGSQLLISLSTEGAEYQCLFCPRIFQQKRYMTRHLKRMHAEVLKEQLKKSDNVICPYCGSSILRQNFKQHSHVCNIYTKKSKKQLEMDLANCQFCGIRMRRHILVKHLAQEHCVENARETSFFFSDDDSDSSTLSGSEHGAEDLKDNHVSVVAAPDQRSLSWKSDTTHHNVTEETGANTQSQSDTRLPSPVPTTSDDYTNCSMCGCLVIKKNLKDHVESEHSDKTGASQDAKSAVSALPGATCSHSMLQRFLNEHSDHNGSSLEECQSCVQRLVAQMPTDDGYVSSNNNCGLPPETLALMQAGCKSTLSATNAAYTVFISKDSGVASPMPAMVSMPTSLVKTESIG